MGKLTDTAIRAAKAPGRYGDGDGLFLHVRAGGSKNWIVRVQKYGRRRDIGLGGYPKLPLAEARKRAALVRTQVELGLDPVVERKRAAGVPSFAAAAARRHAEIGRTMRNPKARAQWIGSLEAYAFPVIGHVGVDAVTPAMVRDVLLPIWLEKPETARRVLQRVSDVLAWAVAHSYRPDMPLLSAKALRLPKQGGRVKAHFKAMAFDDVPGFLASLREREGISRLALEFAILTAARSGEVRGATWDEIDLQAATWSIPAARMKAGKPHRVPLSEAALDCLKRAAALRLEARDGRPALIFPSNRTGRALSDMALTKALRDMGAGVTAHGFRSSFRDWVSERTAFPAEVAEMALSHAIPDAVEAAYRRGDLWDKRKALMDAWGAFLAGSEARGAVVHITGRRGRTFKS